MGAPIHAIVSAGGTGGHVFCALAIARSLAEAQFGAEVLFVGARGEIGAAEARAAGFRAETVRVGGLARRISLRGLARAALLPAELLMGRVEARRIVREFAPDVVLGTGGAASVPVVREAQRRGIPTIVHEQNALPGVANRWLGRRAATVCLGFEAAARFFSGRRTVATGNPVRSGLAPLTAALARARFGLDLARPTVLVLGGSLGSRSLNDWAIREHGRLLAEGAQLLWQCGPAHEAACRARLEDPTRVRLFGFIEDMAAAYAAADLVVSAAGALSIAELAALGKPAIFVPLPEATEDHQTENARALEAQGAGMWISAADVPARLSGAVAGLLGDRARLLALGASMRRAARADANERIVEEILRLVPRAGRGRKAEAQRSPCSSERT
jgi:UDP-N-acetylglucosamine--N-acetylmuramyl-(pentapeptide) pyrophosphoryl-undecaprenol N-acetylglucosamine transferase